MKPIPDNIKEILGQLDGPQQVALKAYIGTLRAEMKDLEAQVHALQNPAPDHGHYHGHELCMIDHGHSEHAHDDKKEHAHGHKEHKHEHNEHCDHKEHDHKEHDYKEHDHKHNEHCDHKEHDHKHTEHCDHKEHHDHHSHEHEHKKHHQHGHDEVPAWKKKAMESDPTEAPFGGSWNTESNVNAKDDHMQE